MTPFERHRTEIAALLDERFYPLWWLEEQIAGGGIGTMHNDAAIIGFERKTYPGGAIELHGLFAAGELEAIKELVAEVLASAKLAGCTVATISSRPGWGRVLKGMGFTPHQNTIMKELTDGA